MGFFAEAGPVQIFVSNHVSKSLNNLTECKLERELNCMNIAIIKKLAICLSHCVCCSDYLCPLFSYFSSILVDPGWYGVPVWGHAKLHDIRWIGTLCSWFYMVFLISHLQVKSDVYQCFRCADGICEICVCHSKRCLLCVHCWNPAHMVNIGYLSPPSIRHAV